jgi:16S rRNA U516 pseudouridylate synthase RsuA-like enzyme
MTGREAKPSSKNVSKEKGPDLNAEAFSLKVAEGRNRQIKLYERRMGVAATEPDDCWNGYHRRRSKRTLGSS